MKIADFRDGLSNLQRMLDNFGAKKQANELRAVIDALAEFNDLTIVELVKRLKAVNSPSVRRADPKAIDNAAVADALGQLNGAVHLSEAFDTTVERVLKDKRLKQGELMELARRFGGSTPAQKSRSAVAAFLKERRLEMRRQDGLGATIDRMFGRN